MPGLSQAQTPESAKRKFAEGVEAFKRGDYEAARKAFSEADAEHHDPIIAYNLGRAEERLEHPEEASHAYERYLAEAGEQGSLGPAAALAIAQIRARSGKLRIDTNPPGAHVFLDGQALLELSPSQVLVRPGEHRVTAESDAARASTSVTIAAGASERVLLTLTATRSEQSSDTPDAGVAGKPEGPPPLPLTASKQKSERPSSVLHDDAPEEEPVLSGFLFGASFAFVPYFFGKSERASKNISALGAQAGVMAEVGYAVTPRVAVTLRGLFSVGPECETLYGSHIGGAGPSVTIRLNDRLWLGVAALAGQASTCREGTDLTTSLVFSPVLELQYALITRHTGQWLLGVHAGAFFANPSNANAAVYTPITFGPRFF
jgi:PEGA domain